MFELHFRFAVRTFATLAGPFLISSCVGNGSSHEEAKASRISVDATREQLQALRPEVDEFVKSLDEKSDPDGMPLLRKDGKLYYWGLDEEFPEVGITWVLDAWGRPIVLIQFEDDRSDWCLISAGPDGLWTDDGTLGAAQETDKQAFAERAPHYYGAEDSVHRRMLGDDIVLHVTGLFFKPYEFPLPNARDVVTSLLGVLSDGSHRGTVPVSSDLIDEVSDLTKEEKDLAAAFVRKHQDGFSLCEDTWSHECSRKDGLLPNLFLCHAKLFESKEPPLWIQPEEDGWVLDLNLDELLDAADPQRKKEKEREAEAEPGVASFEFLGRKIEASGAFFVLELTPEVVNNGTWKDVKEEAIRAITDFPKDEELGIIVYGTDAKKFPASGLPAQANSESKLAAIRFLENVEAGKLEEMSAELAVSAALQVASYASAKSKTILFATTGRAGCADSEEKACQSRMRAAIDARNWQRVSIHAFGLGVDAGSATEEFLKKVCGSNGGAYIQVGK